MARKIEQIRWFGEDDQKNPIGNGNTNLDKLVTGEAFKTNEYAIIQLGIQTLPGVKFYLNGNMLNPIIIGATGIYELSVEGLIKITQISFDSTSLQLVKQSNGYVICDYVYETE